MWTSNHSSLVLFLYLLTKVITFESPSTLHVSLNWEVGVWGVGNWAGKKIKWTREGKENKRQAAEILASSRVQYCFPAFLLLCVAHSVPNGGTSIRFQMSILVYFYSLVLVSDRFRTHSLLSYPDQASVWHQIIKEQRKAREERTFPWCQGCTSPFAFTLSYSKGLKEHLATAIC